MNVVDTMEFLSNIFSVLPSNGKIINVLWVLREFVNVPKHKTFTFININYSTDTRRLTNLVCKQI